MKKLVTVIIICCSPGFAHSFAQSSKATVVYADPADPYYPLALKIVTEESLCVVNDLDGIAAYNPDHVLWVISPGNLTEAKLVEFSLHQKDNMHGFVTGIISGKTVHDARYLWENRDFRPDQEFAFIKGTNKQNRIRAKIIKTAENIQDTMILDKSNLMAVLSSSGYIQMSLHGAARSWFDQASDLTLLYNEVPTLNKPIIESGACENFRPWVENSIALECIEKGAVAFSGFMYSPISGTKIGENNGLIYRYTWDGFPIGAIVQIQNEATQRSYARFPNYFLLGDPRISLNQEPPYTIQSDSDEGNLRILKFVGARTGFLPVKITGGEEFDYIRISSGIKYSENDLFINTRIESIDLNGDKYLLFENTSDAVTIELRKKTPVFWKLNDTVKDTIESIIVLNQYSGNEIAGVVFLVILLLLLFRKKLPKALIFRSLIISMIGIAFLGLIYLICWKSIDITGKMIEFNLRTFLFDWILLFSGVLFYFRVKSGIKRFLSSTIPFLPNLMIIIFYLTMFLIRSVVSSGDADVVKPGYTVIPALSEALIGTLVLYLILGIIKARTFIPDEIS